MIQIRRQDGTITKVETFQEAQDEIECGGVEKVSFLGPNNTRVRLISLPDGSWRVTFWDDETLDYETLG